MSAAPPSEVFRANLRECGYEMTGEIGDLETWIPPPTLTSHVFYVTARDSVTYVGMKETHRDMSFERALELVGKNEE